MKKLLYVSTNTRKLYKELVRIRDTNQRSRIEGSTPLVLFTKAHEMQIKAIERMDDYLNPNKGIKPGHPVLSV